MIAGRTRTTVPAEYRRTARSVQLLARPWLGSHVSGLSTQRTYHVEPWRSAILVHKELIAPRDR